MQVIYTAPVTPECAVMRITLYSPAPKPTPRLTPSASTAAISNIGQAALHSPLRQRSSPRLTPAPHRRAPAPRGRFAPRIAAQHAGISTARVRSIQPAPAPARARYLAPEQGNPGVSRFHLQRASHSPRIAPPPARCPRAPRTKRRRRSTAHSGDPNDSGSERGPSS